MRFSGFDFPGISTNEETHSQRSYSYDPMGTLSQQQTHYHEEIGLVADNLTYRIPQNAHRGAGYIPQQSGPGFLGNVELTKPMFFSDPGWWGGAGVGGFSNDWNDLRQAGVGYGLYAPHLPQHPVPVVKLYEAGGSGTGGFVLPATFLGQPLLQATPPPGA